jgi:hypothetical protein
MNLNGGFEAGSFRRLLFVVFSYKSRNCIGGENAGFGFIEFQGLWEGRKTA